ncbi:hypothetical protein ONZ45_g6255 [Pleurotus djamor]|nr:hypothetical protein ONZ45_g6255 [Pleurotus djamor]
MVNVTGSNGQDPGNVPPDDILRDTLHGYARENLTLEIRLERLISDLGYYIKRTKLSQLNKKFGVPSVRKPPNRPMATTLILAKMAEDPQQLNGPNAVKTFLSLDGVAIPRSTVREVMHDNAPEGAALRQPGGRNKIQRKNLVSYGVFQEVNMDGHEKLGRAALRMGPVGIDIYGCRDKCTGLIARLVVVPNARKATTIGHFYLDFIEEYGGMYLMQPSLVSLRPKNLYMFVAR